MKTSYFLLLIMYLSQSLEAQVIDWEKNYGGSDADQIEHMISSQDGNLLAVATTKSANKDVPFNRGSIDGFVFKTDTKGNILWSVNIGGKGLDNPLKILEAKDGNIYVIGYSGSTVIFPNYNHGSNDVWIVKLSSSGKVLKQKFFGGTGTDLGTGIVEGSGDKLYFCAVTNSTNGDVLSNHGGDDFWVCQIDPDLNLLWSKTFGGSANDRAYSIAFKEKRLVVCGESQSSNGDVPYNLGGADAWFLKIKESGAIIDSKVYGGTHADQAFVVKPNKYGFVALCSSSSSNGNFPSNLGLKDAWVFQLNDQLNTLWSKNYGGSKNDYLYDLFIDKNQNLALLGSTESSNGHIPMNLGLSDFWLMTTDAHGQVFSSDVFGGSSVEYGKGITMLDGDIYLGGGTHSLDHDVSINYGGMDGWILKVVKTPLSKASTRTPPTAVVRTATRPLMQLFPNPTNDFLNIITREPGSYQIINSQGNTLLSGQIKDGKIRINIQDMISGLYHVILNLPTETVVRSFSKID